MIVYNYKKYGGDIVIVYRICKKEELYEIFKGNSFINSGSACSITRLNTHRYESSNKYLHFFQNKSNIFYLRTLKDRYLCVYDIPSDILQKHKGVGYYWDYINFKTLNEVVEYAIETDDMNFEYLKQVSYIKKDIDYDDLIDDYNLTDFLELIYNSVTEKSLVKKY